MAGISARHSYVMYPDAINEADRVMTVKADYCNGVYRQSRRSRKPSKLAISDKLAFWFKAPEKRLMPKTSKWQAISLGKENG